MNKFTVTDITKIKGYDDKKPVLFKIWFGNYYYVHKGKELNLSLNKFLDDVDRGVRGLKPFQYYNNVVKYCITYPQVHNVSVEVLSNGSAETIYRNEVKFYNDNKAKKKKDAYCLNNFELQPYKPEWLTVGIQQKRCEKCPTVGVVDGKKEKFVFCPRCSRVIK